MNSKRGSKGRRPKGYSGHINEHNVPDIPRVNRHNQLFHFTPVGSFFDITGNIFSVDTLGSGSDRDDLGVYPFFNFGRGRRKFQPGGDFGRSANRSSDWQFSGGRQHRAHRMHHVRRHHGPSHGVDHPRGHRMTERRVASVGWTERSRTQRPRTPHTRRRWSHARAWRRVETRCAGSGRATIGHRIRPRRHHPSSHARARVWHRVRRSRVGKSARRHSHPRSHHRMVRVMRGKMTGMRMMRMIRSEGVRIFFIILFLLPTFRFVTFFLPTLFAFSAFFLRTPILSQIIVGHLRR